MQLKTRYGLKLWLLLLNVKNGSGGTMQGTFKALSTWQKL
jgi:hypothetical protein